MNIHSFTKICGWNICNHNANTFLSMGVGVTWINIQRSVIWSWWNRNFNSDTYLCYGFDVTIWASSFMWPKIFSCLNQFGSSFMSFARKEVLFTGKHMSWAYPWTFINSPYPQLAKLKKTTQMSTNIWMDKQTVVYLFFGILQLFNPIKRNCQ